MLLDQDNEISVSVVDVLEIAIKNTPGRRTMAPLSTEAALRYCSASGYRLLDVTAEHAQAVEHLPQIHRDPFDRVLVAQALCEPLRLITRDPKVAAYSDSIIRF